MSYVNQWKLDRLSAKSQTGEPLTKSEAIWLLELCERLQDDLAEASEECDQLGIELDEAEEECEQLREKLREIELNGASADSVAAIARPDRTLCGRLRRWLERLLGLS